MSSPLSKRAGVCMSVFPRQCAILVGGRGTRLGSLTAELPKPLLKCGGRPFLAWILRELSRFGISEILLLAGHQSETVATFAEHASRHLPKPMRITVSRESVPAGTGGALWRARNELDDCFLLVNGDSWFDSNLADFIASAADLPRALAHVLLRETEDTSRYGVAEVSGGLIRKFHERSAGASRGLINAGIYLVRKGALDFAAATCSLEKDVLPQLARGGLLTGHVGGGYFIDIGTPPDYMRADIELPQRLHRPAVFFNLDSLVRPCTGPRDPLWQNGARDALRAATDRGFHVFVFCEPTAMRARSSRKLEFLRWMPTEIASNGGTIDDLHLSPFDKGPIPLQEDSNGCEAALAIILDLASRWEIDSGKSFLLSERQTEVEAAKMAGIAGYRIAGGDVYEYVSRLFSTSPFSENPSHIAQAR
jgi:dTDP-glucose pyrophosphorylase/histidinol phosphatase-like enzyme